MLYLFEDNDSYTPAQAVCSGRAPKVECAYEHYWGVGNPVDAPSHTIRASFVPDLPAPPDPPDGRTCFTPSRAEPVLHTVHPADTMITSFTHQPVETVEGEKVQFTVEVVPVLPGGGTPLGTVYVSDTRGNHCEIALAHSGPSKAAGTCEFMMTYVGSNNVLAIYDPDAINWNPNYNSSQATVIHIVKEKPKPTPTLIPSSTPEPTPTETKTFVPEPVYTDTETPTPEEPPAAYPIEEVGDG
jgi:hypothetical protein